jgi:hypothetical protein
MLTLQKIKWYKSSEFYCKLKGVKVRRRHRKEGCLKPMNKKVRRIFQEERLVQWLVCGWDDETLERDESWFQGNFKPIKQEDMGTINMLRDNVKEQFKEVENETHGDCRLIPWGEGNKVTITQDGAFIWDEELNDYRRVFIETIYEKEWFDDKGYEKKETYFALIVYEK